ncbi:hypothetical protein OAT84_02725 [Gammaproteobacteria bacterium]|nr:hypothetical protein [Gammaproteobacteria bacterium]
MAIKLIETISPQNIIDRANLAVTLILFSILALSTSIVLAIFFPIIVQGINLAVLGGIASIPTLLWGIYLLIVQPTGSPSTGGTPPANNPNDINPPNDDTHSDLNPDGPDHNQQLTEVETIRNTLNTPYYILNMLRISYLNPSYSSRARSLNQLLLLNTNLDYHAFSLLKDFRPLNDAEKQRIVDVIEKDGNTSGYICPISAQLISVPVQITKSEVADFSSVLQWVRVHHTNPFTREPMSVNDLVNKVIKDTSKYRDRIKVILEYNSIRDTDSPTTCAELQPEDPTSYEQRTTPLHGEPAPTTSVYYN